MGDSAIPRNGFLIPETEKCDRQIGNQSLDAEKIRIHVYNPKTGKHEPIIVKTEDFLGFKDDEI